MYGLSFDMLVSMSDNHSNDNYAMYKSGCWNTSLQLRIENGLSTDYFNEKHMERKEMNGSSYGGSDSESWLLSLGQSLLLSLVLWQPLTLYIVTWIKIWMFTWGLEMKFPKNCPALVRRCLCGATNADQLAETVELSAAASNSVNSSSGTTPDSAPSLDQMLDLNTLRAMSLRQRTVIANKSRPRDILQFLADKQWVIDDTVNTNATAGGTETTTSIQIQNIEGQAGADGQETMGTSDAVDDNISKDILKEDNQFLNVNGQQHNEEREHSKSELW